MEGSAFKLNRRSRIALIAFILAASVTGFYFTVVSGWKEKMDGLKAVQDNSEWRMPGGDKGHSGYFRGSLGIQLERSWRRRLDGELTGPAAVSGGRIYLSTEKGWIYCLDLENGKPLWRYDLGSSGSSMPAVHGRNVLVCSSDGRLICLDIDGKLRWVRDVGGTIKSSPTPCEDSVFVGSLDCHVYGFSLAGGRRLWSLNMKAPVDWSPTVLEEQVFAVNREGVLAAVSASDGELVWKYESGDFPLAAPVAGEGKVFLIGEVSVSALDAQSGRLLWRKAFSGGLQAPPSLMGDMLILLLGGKESTTLLGMDVFTGDGVWRSNLSVSPPCSMICSESKVFLMDGRGLRALEKGSSAWIEVLEASNVAGQTLSASNLGFIWATANRIVYCYRFK